MKAIRFLVLVVLSIGQAFAAEQVVKAVPQGEQLRVWFEVHGAKLSNTPSDVIVESAYLNHPFSSLKIGDEVIRRYEGSISAEILVKHEPEHDWWITSAMRILTEEDYVAFATGRWIRIPRAPFPISLWGDSETNAGTVRALVETTGHSMGVSGFGMHNLAAITLGSLPREGDVVLYYGREGFTNHMTSVVWPGGKYTVRGTLGYGSRVTMSYGVAGVSSDFSPMEEVVTKDSIVGVVHEVVYKLSGRKDDLVAALNP